MSSAQADAQVRGGPLVEDRITDKLVDFCTSQDATTLPPETMQAAQRLMLDFAGVALRGSLEPSSRAAAQAAARLGTAGSHGSTAIGYGARLSPQYAALVNGVSAHGLELDDTHPQGGIHLGATIFPTVLAVGECIGATGAEVLAAAVLGYEVSARLALALPLAAHGAHGFHSTGTCGVFGAAAAAARLLGLSAEQTSNALGIAGSQTSGSLEYRTEGAWTKRLHPGWAAHSGVVAAELAAAGFTGPHRIVEGRAGFLRSYSDSPVPHRVLEGLGEDFQILRTAIKPHAACRHSQGAIDAILALTKEHGLTPEMVERITVRIFKAALTSVAEPAERKRRPQSMADAQFNVFFASAGALMWGGVDVERYTPETYASKDLLALIDRVECVSDPELDDLFPKLWPVKVEIVLKDGRHLVMRVDHPWGDPENPLSSEAVTAKFNGLIAPIKSPGQREEILAAAETFAARPARDFVKLLSLDA